MSFANSIQRDNMVLRSFEASIYRYTYVYDVQLCTCIVYSYIYTFSCRAYVDIKSQKINGWNALYFCVCMCYRTTSIRKVEDKKAYILAYFSKIFIRFEPKEMNKKKSFEKSIFGICLEQVVRSACTRLNFFSILPYLVPSQIEDNRK